MRSARLSAETAEFLISVETEIGLILLLFIIGLEIDLRELGRLGRSMLALGVGQFVINSLLGLAFFAWLGYRVAAGRFDLVYAGAGATSELHDLAAWTAGIAAALRPGGGLVLHEHHPVALCVDALGRWREDYFEGEIANMTRERIELSTQPTHFFPLGQVVTALVAGGLAIRSLEELRPERRWGPPSPDDRIPATYLLLAEKRI